MKRALFYIRVSEAVSYLFSWTFIDMYLKFHGHHTCSHLTFVTNFNRHSIVPCSVKSTILAALHSFDTRYIGRSSLLRHALYWPLFTPSTRAVLAALHSFDTRCIGRSSLLRHALYWPLFTPSTHADPTDHDKTCDLHRWSCNVLFYFGARQEQEWCLEGSFE